MQLTRTARARRAHPRSRALALGLAAGALALLAACGSSNRSPATSAGAVPADASAAAPSTGAAGASGTAGHGSGSPSATVKFATTPRYASPAPSAPVRSGLVPIAYRNITIAPDTVRVRVGTTIRWTNYDSVSANVTSEGGPMKFASGDFGKGGTFELKMTMPGVIHYECTLYPTTMNGTIEVLG